MPNQSTASELPATSPAGFISVRRTSANGACAVVGTYDAHRSIAASILGAMIRGSTPEEILDGADLPELDDLERDEMVAHLDILATVLGGGER